MSGAPLLDVRNLSISVLDRAGQRTVTTGIDLEVAHGEAIAIVGESGSGKSLTARAIARVLPRSIVSSGSVSFDGLELTELSEQELRSVRGNRLTMLLQDPFAVLNPLMRARSVIEEMLPDRLSRSARSHELRRRLAEVGLSDAVLRRMPFQLSGGMCQRLAIAAALARDPELLIADEPSTALDASTQAEIVALLHRLQVERGMSMILITHDLRLAFAACRRVYVLYAGSLLEVGDAKEIEDHPSHPYTRGLLLAEPPVEHRVARLRAIPGSVPQPDDVADRCAFVDRCEWAIPPCGERKPELAKVGPGRLSACIRWSEVQSRTHEPPGQDLVVSPDRVPDPAPRRPLVAVRDLGMRFAVRRGEPVRALHNVSIDVFAAESVGLIGASGAGKTTLGRCLVGLETPSDGTVDIAGIAAADFASMSRADRSEVRHTVQMIFQDPYATLNPRHSVRRCLAEALRAAGTPKHEVTARTRALLGAVELPEAYADRRPASLSGGERQRVAIARSMAVRPTVLVCDEPVSGLDISVQAHVLNLFRRLQQTEGMAYLFITHDPAVVRQMADRVYVLHDGEVVEHGSVEDVFTRPRHPYTRRLLSVRAEKPGEEDEEQ